MPWEYGRGQLVDKTKINDPNYRDFLFSTYLSEYHCPSDEKPGLWTYMDRGPTYYYAAQNVRRSNYLFAAGMYSENWPEYQVMRNAWSKNMLGKPIVAQGMFGGNGAAHFQEVHDGLSNTIAIGESIQHKYDSSFGPYWGAGVYTASMGRVFPKIVKFGGQVVSYHINGMWQGGVNPETGQCTRGSWNRCVWAWVFSSHHPGGAQFVMGDGSVKFLSEKMSHRNFRLMNYISDGQPVEFDN